MTVRQWWRQIERHLKNGNWTGLLVCADGIQELGDEERAS